MPHRGQFLPLVARPLAAGVLVLSSIACDRRGEVVVVLDTTMRGTGVEVVAFRSDDARGESANEADRTRVQGRAATPLGDSAAMLATRFREMRDSLNEEVAQLGSLDRRTRAYAVRYAEIRRRTLAAEQLRARRDSVQARAAALSASTDVSARAANAAITDDSARRSLDGLNDLQRHPVSDSTVVLELAAGRWSIGAARGGRLVGELRTLTISPERSDTLRLSGTPGRRGDSP
jgi:hypothetical protein